MKIFDGVHKFSDDQKDSGHQRVIVFNSNIRDLPASDVTFKEDEQRLEIKDGCILVCLGDLWDDGNNNIATARIIANTLKYYASRNKINLVMIWSNKGSLQERLATETRISFIKEAILTNYVNPSDPQGLRFTEYLISIVLLQESYNLNLKINKPGKVETLKNAVLKRSFNLQKLKDLLIKPNLNDQEARDLTTKQQQFKQAIQNAVDPNDTKKSHQEKSSRLCNSVLDLVSNHIFVEGIGLTEDSRDMQNNSDSLVYIYLKWMLINSNLLENRRLDLLREKIRPRADLRRKLSGGEKDVGDVCLAEAMNSIIFDAVAPNGVYRTNIQRSVAALRIGETLFIQGALDQYSLVVNGVDYKYRDIDDWIEAINRRFLTDLRIQYSGDVKFEERMARDHTGSTSGIIDLTFVPEDVIDFLTKNNIKSVVSRKILTRGFSIGGISFDQIDSPTMVNTGLNREAWLTSYGLFGLAEQNGLLAVASASTAGVPEKMALQGPKACS